MCRMNLFFILQMEEFPALEEGEDSAASQSMTMDQEMTLTQSDTPDQLSQEVIVIITDTESDEDQEEGDEEDEEQVESVLKKKCQLDTSYKNVSVSCN